MGYGQLAEKLRRDPRVTSMERVNARTLTEDTLPEPVDLAVMDVSFISITKLLDATLRCLKGDGELLAMVKPQFEAGREHIGKGGVVRDDDARELAVQKVIASAAQSGLTLVGFLRPPRMTIYTGAGRLEV